MEKRQAARDIVFQSASRAARARKFGKRIDYLARNAVVLEGGIVAAGVEEPQAQCVVLVRGVRGPDSQRVVEVGGLGRYA
jgi:hypothetical protein